MEIKKDLYIILDIEGLKYIINKVGAKYIKNNDLVSFIPTEVYKKELEVFNNIYDLSKSTDDEVVDFYFDKVLNFNYTQGDFAKGFIGENCNKDYETKSYYEDIYMYNERLIQCNKIKMVKSKNTFITQNIFYGMDTIIKQYCGYNGRVYPFLEHSPLWDGGFANNELGIISPSIIAYSDYRYDYIRSTKSTKKDVVRIGPYIHYAEGLYNEYFIGYLKKYLGKTLLVFPAHSLLCITSSYDEIEFIKYIDKFAKKNNFKSVLICMFYQDIMKDRDKYFKKNGFKIVSCGHKYDINFLNKLKSLINISDYTMSNIFSTNVGYCIYLNKPHHVFMQKVQYTNSQNVEALKNSKGSLGKVFERVDVNISKEQYKLCNLYWGFSHVRSKEEIKFILDFYEDVYMNCKDKLTINMDRVKVEEIFNDFISLKLSSTQNMHNRLILESRQ
ncbi:hypothetical protein TPDSL_09130 [Terrisporobacter petrolearius]|uniref:hypothetical protein n=1 Tax=Terrisporobacter petrolearius TaxID=1460447 RepID=UPI0033692462